MKQVIVVSGASSGFGALAARELADVGHTVYAGIRDTKGRNAPQAAEVARYAAENAVNLRPLELDVTSGASVDAAIRKIVEDRGRLDVIVHNAGHMSFGPAEAFTPEQFAELYDVNVLGTQRINRAALPVMRKLGRGLLVWVSSSSARGGTPPYLAPYFAAKAAMDSLAVSYASELTRWGIETSIIVPGAFTKGTQHFAHAGAPADSDREKEYDEGPYEGLREQSLKGLASLEPPDADASAVATAIVAVVDMPFGKRPFRTHIDPSQDGCEVVNGVADRVRAELFRRIGLEDLLSPDATRIDSQRPAPAPSQPAWQESIHLHSRP